MLTGGPTDGIDSHRGHPTGLIEAPALSEARHPGTPFRQATSNQTDASHTKGGHIPTRRAAGGVRPPSAQAPDFWRQRSRATARTMMVPVTICCTQLARPYCEQPMATTDMIVAPSTVPSTVPLPPVRLPPPMITAAITSSS